MLFTNYNLHRGINRSNIDSIGKGRIITRESENKHRASVNKPVVNGLGLRPRPFTTGLLTSARCLFRHTRDYAAFTDRADV